MRHNENSFSISPIDKEFWSYKDKSEQEKMRVLFGTLNDIIERHNALAKFVVNNQNEFEDSLKEDVTRKDLS